MDNMKNIEGHWPEPKKITIEDINEKLRKASNYGLRNKEDLVSGEETTKTLEEGETKSIKVLSPEETGKRAGKFAKELEERNKKNLH